MKAQKLMCRKRKTRFLACFEPAPAVVEEHDVEEDKQMTAAAAAGSLPASSPGLTPSSSSGSSLTDGEGEPRRGRRRLLRRLLAKIIRSLVFVTSLKAHNEESLQHKKQVPHQPVASGERAWDEDVPSSGTGFSSSSFSSSSTGTASSGTASSGTASSGLLTMTSRPTLAQTGKVPERKTPPSRRHRDSIRGDSSGGGDDSVWTGLCLVLLLVLFVLAFWGRMCAIVWTSACLCLVPGRDRSDGTAGRGPPRVPSAVVASTRRGSAEEWEKRRVVLEGLLDRRRRP